MVPANSTRASPTPAYSGSPTSSKLYQYGTLTPYGTPSQMFPVPFARFIRVLQPPNRLNNLGLGFSPFARHYLGNHFCFLLLRVLRCFSSPGSPPIISDYRSSTCRVAPFGYPRITECVLLPAASRSLPRPSSPLRA